MHSVASSIGIALSVAELVTYYQSDTVEMNSPLLREFSQTAVQN